MANKIVQAETDTHAASTFLNGTEKSILLFLAVLAQSALLRCLLAKVLKSILIECCHILHKSRKKKRQTQAANKYSQLVSIALNTFT